MLIEFVVIAAVTSQPGDCLSKLHISWLFAAFAPFLSTRALTVLRLLQSLGIFLDIGISVVFNALQHHVDLTQKLGIELIAFLLVISHHEHTIGELLHHRIKGLTLAEQGFESFIGDSTFGTYFADDGDVWILMHLILFLCAFESLQWPGIVAKC